MNSPNWEKIKEIFAAAAELSGDERERFLRERCGADADLRRSVEELLQSHDAAGDFLGKSAVAEVAGEVLAGETTETLRGGQRFGRYEIVKKLGAGGMGEVYLATDVELGREVALKVLPAALARDADRMQRFAQDARAASALNHPHIVTIYETGAADGWRFIAAEYVAGETLRERVRAKNLTLGVIVRIAAQIADALAAAHRLGIVHRDIKPENIIVRPDNSIKVLDFGLAKFSPGNEKLRKFAGAQIATEPGLILGTIAYMSPEQMRGQAANAASDVWSLGAVLFEMLAGKTPFAGETESDRLAATLTGDAPPVSALVKIPARLERIVARALAKNRAERYADAGEMLEDLIEFERDAESSGENMTTLERAEKSRATGGDSTSAIGDARRREFSGEAIEKNQITETPSPRKSTFARRPILIFAALVVFAASVWSYFAFFKSNSIAPNAASQEKPKNPRGTDSDEAYRLYLTAMSLYRKSNYEEARAALDYLERAVALDPNFARAYAQIADVYLFLTSNSILTPSEGTPKIRAAAERAVQIDPNLTKAYVALGNADNAEYKWQSAIENFRRAEQLDPNDGGIYFRYAEVLSFTGQHDAAIEKARRLVELDPLRPNSAAVEGEVLYFARRFDEAEKKLSSVLRLQPDNSFARAFYAYTLAAQKRFDEAIEQYEIIEKSDADQTTSPILQVANLEARAGNRRAARRKIEQAQEIGKFISPGELAMVYANLGETDKAFRLLEEAVTARDYYVQYLKVDANFDALRGDSRFDELLRRINLLP